MSKQYDPFRPPQNGVRPGLQVSDDGPWFPRARVDIWLHEQGRDHAHIELQLAHAPRNAVSAAYNHALYLAPRAKMMQHWADYLEGLTRGKHSTEYIAAQVRRSK